MWELTNGPIPAGMHVCHHCDNPPCCNPAHLFLGTNTDNIKDRVAKGRSGHTNAKLTPERAHDIRRRYAAGGIFQRELAAEYGVTRSCVQHVIHGNSWRHSLPASK
jgi:hypothetical protein